MPKLLFDQFHISVIVAKDLPESACHAARRTLNSARFAAELRRALRAVFQRHSTLRQTSLTLSR